MRAREVDHARYVHDMDWHVAVGQVWEVRDPLGVLPARILYLVEKMDRFIPYYRCIDLELGVKTTQLVTAFLESQSMRVA